MARRKTVREESRREAGTLDMAYSTLSLSLLGDGSAGFACLAVMGVCEPRCQAREVGEPRGRGFYSPPRPRRQVGLWCPAPAPGSVPTVFPTSSHPSRTWPLETCARVSRVLAAPGAG